MKLLIGVSLLVCVYVAGSSDQYVVYDTKKIIDKLMNGGMSYDEAVEFHEFNQACAWWGGRTPGFVEHIVSTTPRLKP